MGFKKIFELVNISRCTEGAVFKIHQTNVIVKQTSLVLTYINVWLFCVCCTDIKIRTHGEDKRTHFMVSKVTQINVNKALSIFYLFFLLLNLGIS